MKFFLRTLISSLVWIGLLASGSIASDRVAARLIHNGENLGLVLRAAPGWHVSVKQDGTPGLDPNVTIVSPNSVRVTRLDLPKGQAFNAAGLTFYGYEGSVTIPVHVTHLPQSGTVQATVRWLVCGDVCVPETETLTIDMGSPAISFETVEPNQRVQTPTITGLGVAVLGAFVGGLILNLMPCVFPVLSIKLLSLSRQAVEDAQSVRRNGLAFSAGMMVTMWGLAGLLISVQSTAAALGWGFQLQSPYVVTGLIILFTLIGFNLFGVFEAGLFLTRVGGTIQKKGLIGSVLNGALVTIVATPCTAPFMGSALGYAITQPAWVTVCVLTALGTGLALPYLVISWMPQLTRYLPKPGAWMETLRQFLAFPMFATAVWLMVVLQAQVGAHALNVVWAVLGIGVITWAYGKLLTKRSPFRWVALVLAGAAIGWTILQANPIATKPSVWRPYSPQAVQQITQKGRPVFIDFTAEWCLTCQVNKRTTLSNPHVIEAFNRKNVALFRADWTNQDPVITAALNQLGRNGVPVYVMIIPNQKRPTVLPEILTPRLVISAIDQIDDYSSR